MKELLADKYTRLKAEEDNFKKNLAEEIYPGIENLVGKTIYECHSSKRNPNADFDEWEITGYSVLWKDIHGLAMKLGDRYCFPYAKKITKALIADCEDYLSKLKDLSTDDLEVIFYVERNTPQWKSSKGIRYSKDKGFEDRYGKINYSFNKDDFNERIENDRKEYEEHYAPREGYVACERCGKQVPENEVVKYKLIYQTWDSCRGRYVASRIGTFCSGECALNEQMSLEG
jgi:hypothetical protein